MIATLGLAGCASEPTPTIAPKTAPGGAVTAGVVDRPPPPGLNDPNSPLSQRVIYFDYDNSNIKPEFVEVLRAHARYIATTPKAKVMLEGHTDERGTREFNLALAEDRAAAVRRFMRAEGAAESQLGILTFGEEKPTQPGQGEQIWALNRRVELVY
jgi:peptidoglycan-associated lipoprotein